MGEAKRRKAELGEQYGKTQSGFSWTKDKTAQFMKWTTRGSWIGIGVVVAVWVTIRFIGPGLGWWHVE